jgi:hypothetical protein
MLYNLFLFDKQYELDRIRSIKMINRLNEKIGQLRKLKETDESITNDQIENKCLVIKILTDTFSIDEHELKK